VLASNIGEIPMMLESEQGMAGELFDLVDWTIPVEQLGRHILGLANDRRKYERLVHCVPFVAANFDPVTIVDKYDTVYMECLRHRGHVK